MKNLLLFWFDWWFRSNFSHLSLWPHVEFHPVLAGEPAGDLVPHWCCITTSPRQDGIALLGVVLQKIRQVVHHIVDCNPAIMRLVVFGHFRQGDVTSFLDLHWLQEHLVRVFLYLRCLLVISCIQCCSLLRLHSLKLRLEFLIQGLVVQQDRQTLLPCGQLCLAQDSVQFFLHFSDSSFTQSVPEGLGHQTFIKAEVSKKSFRPQVRVNLHTFVNLVEEL
mmetsp:Transcript_21160/g.46648  ORF Transcript_21160/g.46648 Transcript_21160/m.46648 type:complete len:220 (+) Transcript_21160:1186-1845(+)